MEKLKIGDTHAGGIIFYLDSSGTHGKICSKKDIGHLHWDNAKQACEKYNDEGYTDWYLPKKEELKLMHKNLKSKGLGDFTLNDGYWSSSTYEGMPIAFSFRDGMEDFMLPGNDYYVRPIREFWSTFAEVSGIAAGLLLQHFKLIRLSCMYFYPLQGLWLHRYA